MADLQPTTVDGTLNSLLIENVKTGSHTLTLNDRDRVVAMDNPTDATVTIPNDSTTDFPIGSIVYINRLNSGNVTLAAASGVTVSKTGNLALFEELFIRKRNNNFWIIVDVTKSPTASGGSETQEAGAGVSTFTSDGTFVVE